MRKLIPILLLLVACSTPPDYTYTIHKGDHWATPLRLERHTDPTLTQRVNFSSDCLYDESKQTYPGWNKIGYWFNGIHPHIGNGVTFVWRCINGKLTLGWYAWVKGVSPMDTKWDGSQAGVLCEIEPGRDYLLTIIAGDSITFIVDGLARVKTGLSFQPTMILQPYFGGRETASHTMHIQIEKKNFQAIKQLL